MRGLFRVLFLGAAFVLVLWLLLRLSPDRPTTVQAPPAATGEDRPVAADTAPWTQEDRAIWRETMDRRLR